MLIIDFVVLEWLNDKARFFFIFVLTRGTPVVKPHVVSSACVKPQNLFFFKKTLRCRDWLVAQTRVALIYFVLY